MKYIIFAIFLLFNNVAFAQNRIYEEIQYCENVKSKFYVSIILPNRTLMKVPVVNGLLPEVVNFCNQDGSIKRVFNYNREIPYLGGIPEYVPLTNTLLKCPSAPNTQSQKPYERPVLATPSASEIELKASEIEIKVPEMKKGSEVNGKLKMTPTYQQ